MKWKVKKTALQALGINGYPHFKLGKKSWKLIWSMNQNLKLCMPIDKAIEFLCVGPYDIIMHTKSVSLQEYL